MIECEKCGDHFPFLEGDTWVCDCGHTWEATSKEMREYAQEQEDQRLLDRHLGK